MLSILIPIYNYSCIDLVTSLIDSAEKAGIVYEIICIDDCSTIADPNKSAYSSLKNVRFIQLDKNCGRAKVRNLLADSAKYEQLLFIDSDMSLVNNDYILKYKEHIIHQHIVFGGLTYRNVQTENVLRLKYGLEREALPVQKRILKPYISTKTCNLLIPKKHFNELRFEESLTQYGHEDTLFSIEIERKAFDVIHIDNPLYHDGIESSKDYLHKVRLASENLVDLERHFLSEQEMMEFNLIRIYYKLEKLFLLKPIISIISIYINTIEKNLCSKNPSMLFLDFYKLYYFNYYKKV